MEYEFFKIIEITFFSLKKIKYKLSHRKRPVN